MAMASSRSAASRYLYVRVYVCVCVCVCVHACVRVRLCGFFTRVYVCVYQPLCREALVEDSRWELSIVTDGLANTQRVQVRCDKVVHISLAPSYVRHVARIFDTTSHFLASLRDEHIKMCEKEQEEDTKRHTPNAGGGAGAGAGGATSLPASAGEEEEDQEAVDDEEQDAARACSMLDHDVWLQLHCRDGVERQVRLPSLRNVVLGAVGVVGAASSALDVKTHITSIRLRFSAAGEWSEWWTPAFDRTHLISCPNLRQGGVGVVKAMLMTGAHGLALKGEGEMVVLWPIWRFQNLLPFDLSLKIHSSAAVESGNAGGDAQAHDHVPEVVASVCVKSGTTMGLCWQVEGSNHFGLSATMAGFEKFGALSCVAADFSSVTNLTMVDRMGHSMVMRLEILHSIRGVPTIVAYVPIVLVNRTALALVLGYRWTPTKKAGREEEDAAVQPNQGPRLLLAPGMHHAPSRTPAPAQGEETGAQEGDAEEAWVTRTPESFALSPPCLQNGGRKESGREELGVALKGSPFWTFLGQFAAEGQGALDASFLTPGTACAVRLQSKETQAVYNLGVQVDMGSRPLHRTMYITLVPRLTIINHHDEILEVRYHVPTATGLACAADRSELSGAPGVLIHQGQMRVLYQGACQAGSNDIDECVEFRVVDGKQGALSLWSGPCTVSRASHSVSVRLVPAERAREGAPDWHLVLALKPLGAALFVHVTREIESTCLYGLDNMSGYVDVSVMQKASPLGARHCALVESGDSKPLALDCPDLAAILIIQPAMLDAMEVDLAQQGAHGVLPTRDGSDTYIHWVVALKGRRRVVVLTSRVGSEALDDFNPLEWHATMHVAGVSLSLVDKERREVLHAQISDIKAEAHKALLHLRTQVRIAKAQIDNPTTLGPPIAFLSPAVRPDGSVSNQGPGEQFLTFEAELSQVQVRGLAYWKSLSIEAAHVMLQLQEDWLLVLLHFEQGLLLSLPHSHAIVLRVCVGTWQSRRVLQGVLIRASMNLSFIHSTIVQESARPRAWERVRDRDSKRAKEQERDSVA